MSTPDLPGLKRVIRAFRQDEARQLLHQTLRVEDASEIRRLVTEALDRAGVGGLVEAERQSVPQQTINTPAVP